MSLKEDVDSNVRVNLQNLPNDSSPSVITSKYPVHEEAHTEQSKKDRNTQVHTGWSPFILKRPILYGFITFFGCAFATLEAMHQISTARQGLATQDDRNHYFWTYGPTAVFIIVLSFFAQVDYRIRELEPWRQMAKGIPIPASKSLLVDYNSPFLPFALISAARNRHFLVIISMCGYLTLKLIVILSTGLFVLQSQDVINSKAILSVHDAFTAQSLDVPDDDYIGTYGVYGNLALSLPYPNGTTSQYAVQGFAFPDSQHYRITLLGAQVEVFTADLYCEYANMTSVINLDSSPTFEFQGPSGCQIEVTPDVWANGTNYWGFQQLVNCTNESNSSANESSRISIGMVEQNSDEIRKFSCLLCTSQYWLEEAQVTRYENGSLLSIETVPNSSKRVMSVPQSDFAASVSTSISNYLPIEHSIDNATLSLDSFWDLLLVQEPMVDFHAYLDPSTLRRYSRQLYTTIAVQLAKRYLTDSTNHKVVGKITYSQQRLLVRGLSLRWMQGLLLVMTIIIICIIWKRPEGVVSNDPRTLETLAAILAASPRVKTILSRLRPFYHVTPKVLLGTHLYHSNISISDRGIRSFSIEVTQLRQPRQNSAIKLLSSDDTIEIETLNAEEISLKHPVSTPQTWWKPLVLRKPVLSTGLALLVSLIIALEIVLSYSIHHSGISDINLDNYTRYVWVYIPAFVMFIAASLVHSFKFAILTLQPYHALRHGAPAMASIRDSSRGNMSLVVLYHAIKRRHITVFVATLAALLVSFLTIVVSGLYTSHTVPLTRTVVVTQLDRFNASWTIADDNKLDSIAIPLVVSGTLSYPPWTYSEIVFPAVQMSVLDNFPQSSYDAETGDFLEICVPALRATMNCTQVPITEYLHINITANVTEAGPLVIGYINFDDGGAQGQSYIKIPSTGGYVGFLINKDVFIDGTGFVPTSVGVLYGHVSNDSELTHEFITLRCQPYVEEISTNITLLFPDLSVDPARPPKVNESTAQFFGNKSVLTALDIDDIYPMHAYTGPGSFDTFFQYLLESNTTSQAELMNSDVLISTLQHQYRVFMTQVLNYNTRINISSSDASQLNGSYTILHRLRLEQNVVSTRLLQGIIILCIVCILMVYFCMDSSRLLFEEPGNLGSIFGMLAKQDIVTRNVIPEGSEWENTARWSKGFVFSLGWWTDDTENEQSFGISIGKADRA